ncbi:hypothetical protein GCM10023113_00170 [Cellulomonas oligotrophica]|uniref:Uncharacterized protein n=1 Tax=Cellulomonas oligotrophica TaxID=931536 RepID=A0ABQ4DF01_9CELL|nr:hypothetical protein Col01nite_34630 [Cellulomonas oligotrophica]
MWHTASGGVPNGARRAGRGATRRPVTKRTQGANRLWTEVGTRRGAPVGGPVGIAVRTAHMRVNTHVRAPTLCPQAVGDEGAQGENNTRATQHLVVSCSVRPQV